MICAQISVFTTQHQVASLPPIVDKITFLFITCVDLQHAFQELLNHKTLKQATEAIYLLKQENYSRLAMPGHYKESLD